VGLSTILVCNANAGIDVIQLYAAPLFVTRLQYSLRPEKIAKTEHGTITRSTRYQVAVQLFHRPTVSTGLYCTATIRRVA
jgi:hypothetical protein